MIIIQLLKDTKKSAKHQTVIDNSLDNYAIAKDFFSALPGGGQASQRQLPLASKYPSIAQRAPCSNRQTGQRVTVREIRYRKQPPTVRNTHSVLKKASWGTRRIFRGIRCKKQASTVRKGYSVPKTASSGTRRIFKGALNSLLLHRMHLKRPAEQPTPQTVDSLLPHRTWFQCAKQPPLGGD